MDTNTCSLGQLNWKQKSPWILQTWFRKSKACWSVFIWILFYFILFSIPPKAKHSSLTIKNNGLRNVLLYHLPTAVWVCITQMCLAGPISFSGPDERDLWSLHVGYLGPPNGYPGISQKMVFQEQCISFLLTALIQVTAFQSSHPLV